MAIRFKNELEQDQKHQKNLRTLQFRKTRSVVDDNKNTAKQRFKNRIQAINLQHKQDLKDIDDNIFYNNFKNFDGTEKKVELREVPMPKPSKIAKSSINSRLKMVSNTSLEVGDVTPMQIRGDKISLKPMQNNFTLETRNFNSKQSLGGNTNRYVLYKFHNI